MINAADTAWMLISTALVLLMTPALGFFYGGLVRSKNALNTMMMSYIALGFVGILWAMSASERYLQRIANGVDALVRMKEDEIAERRRSNTPDEWAAHQ